MRKRKGRGKHNFLAKARERMEEKGTVGAFGKATSEKISRGKAKGGLSKKRAVFAENMKRIAAKRKKGKGRSKGYRRR